MARSSARLPTTLSVVSVPTSSPASSGPPSCVTSIFALTACGSVATGATLTPTLNPDAKGSPSLTVACSPSARDLERQRSPLKAAAAARGTAIRGTGLERPPRFIEVHLAVGRGFSALFFRGLDHVRGRGPCRGRHLPLEGG